jgi:glycosyltransferase involved in cell wall biosynthesis
LNITSIQNNQTAQTFSHCFALCAYKESPYLEECLASLKNQALSSKVIIATSTPNKSIERAAQKYDVPLFVNPSSGGGIAADWNFAYASSDAAYVTIAHQDDVYFSEYTRSVSRAAREDALILFTDYAELCGDTAIEKSPLLSVKRRMNHPLRLRALQKSRFVRNRILSLGSSVCCPSVTFHKSRLSGFSFDPAFKCDLDWDAWSRIARQKGSFVYIPDRLMGHRIHGESETTRLLGSGERFLEDLAMLRRFWPAPLAKLVMRLYRQSAKSNEKNL